MRRALGLLLLAALLAVAAPASAQTTSPCTSVVPISQSSGTKLVAGATGKYFRLCSVALTNSNAAAQTVQLVEGTGTVCATGQTILYNFALGAVGAGPGIGMASPFPFAQTQVPGDDLCLLGGAATISGGISYRLE